MTKLKEQWWKASSIWKASFDKQCPGAILVETIAPYRVRVPGKGWREESVLGWDAAPVEDVGHDTVTVYAEVESLP
jgi:hypothetical protein